MNSKIHFYLITLLLITHCTLAAEQATTAKVKYHDIEVLVPKGWQVTQNDQSGSGQGALCVLIRKGTSEKLDPCICLWFGDYAPDLAKLLGVTPGTVMLLMPSSEVVGAATIAGNTDALFTSDYSYPQKTEHTFLHFKVRGLDGAAAVSVLTDAKGAKLPLTISFAATASRLEDTRKVADALASVLVPKLPAEEVPKAKLSPDAPENAEGRREQNKAMDSDKE
ncbi:MAG: hypothetical protein JW951_06880 [Lentisphaerae bacterium]|nr:hypothetical protein [Lentisphaerota bacterium]